MATFFIDSSAVVKIYVNETGTRWMRQLVEAAQGNTILIAYITGVEVVSAIARRLPGGNLSAAQVASALRDFRRDFVSEFHLVGMTDALLQQAMNLAESHRLRGYDAVQLAAAVQTNRTRSAAGLPPITLLSSDVELNAAALAEGLLIDDPNSHP